MGSKLIHFSVEPLPAMRVIGKTVQVKEPTTIDDPTITDLLKAMDQDGSMKFLLSLPERATPDPDTVGWMGDFHPEEGIYTYLAGVLVKPGTPAPEGFEARDIVACDMGIAWIKGIEGEEGGDQFGNASENLGKAREAQGYMYDMSKGGFEMEVYTYQRFFAPQERGEPPVLDFYSPCRKVEETA